MKKVFVVLVVGLLFSGCVSTTPHETRQLRGIESTGATCDEIKNPGTAAFLNLLPGIGDFYNASGTGQGHLWAVGTLDLLLWPYSIVWGMPQAAITAGGINDKECVYYYTATIDGKKEMARRKRELAEIDLAASGKNTTESESLGN